MARKLPYFQNNFSGGMTHTPRDTSDLTKVSYISHIDIYRDKNAAYVMPGYVDDMAVSSTPDGMKDYNVKAIANLQNQLFAVGTKIDGTGSKLLWKNNPEDAEWNPLVFGTLNAEGTDNLFANTYLTAGPNLTNIFWATVSGAALYVTRYDLSTVTDKHRTITLSGAAGTVKMVSEQHYTGSVYATETPSSGLSLVDAVLTLDNKATAIFPRDIHSGGEYLGILGSTTPSRATRLILWDTASLLVDQNIFMGFGVPIALGYPSSVWVGVINEGLGADTTLLTEANNLATMSVKALSGDTAETLYRFYGASSENAITLPMRSSYRDSMLWYARIATNQDATEFKEGVWACGKGDITTPLGVSVLFDTSSLGTVQHAVGIGNHYFFVHGDDGSISRLDAFETGVYDVPGTIETLIYGAETPQKKNLNGISITTENLPAGGSVQVFYRTDVDDAWVSMGTSSTAGTRKHNFTKRTGGIPIGEFQEIQFRIILTGKIAIKNFYVSLTELDDISFN